jgi:ribosome-associated translation inhibitor RaiA
MSLPLEIHYEDISRSTWVDDYIRERAEKLERLSEKLISCRVVVERAQHSSHTGNPFRARVEVAVPPKKELVADHEGRVDDPSTQLRPIIRKAFEAVEKQLSKHQAKLRRGK